MIRIYSDSGSDLSEEYQKKYDIHILPLGLNDGEREYQVGRDIDLETLYDRMIEGVNFHTSQVLRSAIDAVFRKELEEGNEIIFVALSSGLSGTYSNAKSVQAELEKEFPGKLHVVDSRTASQGEAFLAIKAACLLKQGKSSAEILSYLEEARLYTCELFTVGDLEYLYRGGRVSRTGKWASQHLKVLPMLDVEKEKGTLEVKNLYRGGKSLIKKAKAFLNEKSVGGQFDPNQQVIIFSGRWPEQVKLFHDFLIEEMGMEEKNIFEGERVGCIIGAHTGPEVASITFSFKPDEICRTALSK